MKIVALIATHNEEDIIKEVIEHLLSQGLEIVLLDNGSTDQTYEICKKFQGSGVSEIFQFKSTEWELGFNLRTLYQMALRQKPDWIVLNDADEFLESGTKNSLKEEIIKADSKGYNLIQFDSFNFYLTDDDMLDADSIKKRLPYYSFTTDFVFRAWKYYPGILIEPKGGHVPIFPEGKKYEIYPQNLVLRHYRFRSTEHAQQKMRERLKKISRTEKEMGWHTHQDVITKQDFTKKVNHNLLTKYEEDKLWNCEVKYSPFLPSNHPINSKEDLFSENGFLRNRPSTFSELRVSIKRAREKIAKLETEIHNRNPDWPNLFIVGAPRCATTSIFRYLGGVQGICISSMKEPHYFADFSVPKNDPVLTPIREKIEYLNLFQKKQNDSFLCEASTHYLADRISPFLIKKLAPEAKIIINLRDPVERAFSFYLHVKRGGWIKDSFHDLITKEISNKLERNKPHSLLRHGLYNENVRRYCKVFGPKNVKILIFEEFIRNPKNYFMEILKFLNLPNSHYNGDFKKFNEGPPGNSMTNEDRTLLKEFYNDTVEKLEMFLNQKMLWPNFNN